MEITAFDLAQRFIGLKEVAGPVSNPQVLAMLQLDGAWPTDDSVPWCSAFVNYIAWLLRLPRSKSLAARSWLNVARPVSIGKEAVGFDVVVLERGAKGSELGHVGFFAGRDATGIHILGGNQSNSVSVEVFTTPTILGIRRLIGE